MSYAEVLDEVQSWPSDDRQKLAPHLKILEIINDPATMERVSRGIEEIEAGDRKSVV